MASDEGEVDRQFILGGVRSLSRSIAFIDIFPNYHLSYIPPISWHHHIETQAAYANAMPAIRLLCFGVSHEML